MSPDTIFGIHIGSLNSDIAYIDKFGSVVNCPNECGDLVTPSVVDLTDESFCLVGREAKDNKIFYPHSVIDYFVRKIGDGTEPIYYGEDLEKETNTVNLVKDVLKSLIKNAEDLTSVKVEKAVITVPAFYGTEEKKNLTNAAFMSGINKVFLLEEPIAVAAYYEHIIGNNSGKKTVLVYDLGDSFDATIVDIDGSQFNCVLYDGDRFLGGKDWGRCMISLIYQYLSEYGVEECDLDDEFDDFDKLVVLKAAEKAIKTLSIKDETIVKLKLIVGKYSFVVNRKEFEESTESIMLRTIEKTKSLICQAEKRGIEVTEILLAGGLCNLPQIKERLVEEFPSIVVKEPLDPNLSCSKGASIVANTHIII